jgi:nucleoside-diphosphate-sugar epimerase
MKNILVVGGAGYIGGVLTDILMAKRYTVTVFDRLLYEDRFLKNVPFIFGDIRDTDQLVAIHAKYDTIIWLAALVGDGACAQDPELTYEVNYHALKRFLDKTNRKIIYPSTCSVYGAQEGILTEQSPTNPLSVYADTKLLGEKLVLQKGGLAFRLGTLFGVGDNYSRLRLDLVVNVLTYKALADKKITVFGGEQWRPVLAVSDVAEYFAEAVTRDYNDVFNLSKSNIRVKDLAGIYKNIIPDLAVEIVDSKFEDLRNYQVSTEKSDKNFIFKPKVSIESEVHRMMDLLRERRIKNPLDPIYYNTHFVKATLDKIWAFERAA